MENVEVRKVFRALIIFILILAALLAAAITWNVLKDTQLFHLAKLEYNSVLGKRCIGIYIQDTRNGLKISQIEAGSPANVWGLEPGMFITAVDGTRINDIVGFKLLFSAYSPGDVISLNYRKPLAFGLFQDSGRIRLRVGSVKGETCSQFGINN